MTSQKLRDREDTTPPILEITESVQTGPMLILNGRTEPGALLWVDNEKVDVDRRRHVYAVIRLREGGSERRLARRPGRVGNVSSSPTARTSILTEIRRRVSCFSRLRRLD